MHDVPHISSTGNLPSIICIRYSFNVAVPGNYRSVSVWAGSPQRSKIDVQRSLSLYTVYRVCNLQRGLMAETLNDSKICRVHSARFCVLFIWRHTRTLTQHIFM